MNNDTYQSLPEHTLKQVFAVRRKTRKLRVAIFGNFGAKNIGDEAILAGQIDLLKKQKDVYVSVFSRFPKSIRTLHGIQGISLYKLPSVLPEIIKADALIVGGGGLFCKNTTHLVGLSYQLYITSLFLLLPVLLRKPVFVLGIGFYENANPLIKAWVTFLFRFIKELTVRDTHSYQALRKRQLPVSLMKDFSFSMDLYTKQDMLTDSFFTKNYIKGKTHVGIALKKPETDRDAAQVKHNLVRFMNESKNTHFWFYSLDVSVYENDLLFMKDIAKTYITHGGLDESVHFIPSTWHPKKVFSSFKLMDFMIAMRLHGIIFSYRTKTPFLGISYDKKCESFLKAIGHEVYYPNKNLVAAFQNVNLTGGRYAN